MKTLNQLFEEVLRETESKREYEIIQDGNSYDKLVIKDQFDGKTKEYPLIGRMKSRILRAENTGDVRKINSTLNDILNFIRMNGIH